MWNIEVWKNILISDSYNKNKYFKNPWLQWTTVRAIMHNWKKHGTDEAGWPKLRQELIKDSSRMSKQKPEMLN